MKDLLRRIASRVVRQPQQFHVSSTGALKAKLDEQASAIQYLLDEVSDLRRDTRELLGQSGLNRNEMRQTRESFAFQWAEITEGKHLLGDPEFEGEMVKLLETYSGYKSDWFKGKKVLDAGCGNGRWSYVMARLGAKVTAVDQSDSGVAAVSKHFEAFPDVHVQQANILDPLPFKPEFDFVWSYGVTHHTGYTKLAVENVAAMVKPGGRLFLMIYGEPVCKPEFDEINNYVDLRRKTQFMTFKEKEEFLGKIYPKDLVHGYFDAVSPIVNDLHRFDEIENWLRQFGFVDIRPTLENRNHHLIAQRPN